MSETVDTAASAVVDTAVEAGRAAGLAENAADNAASAAEEAEAARLLAEQSVEVVETVADVIQEVSYATYATTEALSALSLRVDALETAAAPRVEVSSETNPTADEIVTDETAEEIPDGDAAPAPEVIVHKRNKYRRI